MIVELNQKRFAELAQVFASFQVVFTDLLEDYSDEQLATIAHYLTRAVQHSREVIAKLSQERKRQKTAHTG